MTKPNSIGLGEYTNEDLLAELAERGYTRNITRFEIIDTEREVVFLDKNKKLDLSFQDDNRTLKVFIAEREDDEEELPVSSRYAGPMSRF